MNARLIDGFTENILEAIENGVPMGFTYEIELRKENAVWADSLISSNTVRHKVQYEPLKKSISLFRSGEECSQKSNHPKNGKVPKTYAHLEQYSHYSSLSSGSKRKLLYTSKSRLGNR
jgi:hypothetical protein